MSPQISHRICNQPFLGFGATPEANPTTSSYNASVVKIYSATNSMARIHNKNIFSLT
jgi:hypothetical protein